MDNNSASKRQEYRSKAQRMGIKEFTLMKMQEYGFWPAGLPTPYERQTNETREDQLKREALIKELESIAAQIAELYKEKTAISDALRDLQKQYGETWDYEKIRKDVAAKIMKESIARRAERKRLKEEAKQLKHENWMRKKVENIVFIGRGYSSWLNDTKTDIDKLSKAGLPLIQSDKELASALGIEYHELRFLVYHRDVVSNDHYHHYTVPKRSGGTRNIAAPKPLLKRVQRKLLELILEKIETSDRAHGFLSGRSVISGANAHVKQPYLLINIDIKDFFPTITFQRVRGMFKSFGYSGNISSLLAMLCTYCERFSIEVNGQTKFVKVSERILPQGAPTSPMITNIICKTLDENLFKISQKYSFSYSRYADDMSFSTRYEIDRKRAWEFVHETKSALKSQGFEINSSKTRFLKSHNRQAVTGIVINNGQLSVPRSWARKMRAALHNARIRKDDGTLTKETLDEICGMASWLESVNKTQYTNLINEAKELTK